MTYFLANVKWHSGHVKPSILSLGQSKKEWQFGLKNNIFICDLLSYIYYLVYFRFSSFQDGTSNQQDVSSTQMFNVWCYFFQNLAFYKNIVVSWTTITYLGVRFAINLSTEKIILSDINQDIQTNLHLNVASVVNYSADKIA